ncbi:hypothetical protein SCHPADRAFT_910207 [Schizopora paradoxa]|uniref:60S ribosomal protein L27 n=1 Tax=Schizopora paradoxa TaxID=27342 RepID=A0A0H2R4C0_9AGAM|nr:hypothetical protein SCHPADRAFT_910207 [Schizopora paradoxa]
MGKIYKPGKVCIVLQGRHAGKKVVVVKPLDNGDQHRKYPYALIAGVERYPLKITKRMNEKKVKRRSKVKPFIKIVNYSHLFPTRYTYELQGLKDGLDVNAFKEPETREKAKKHIKEQFEERYNSGKNKWFFQPLRF